MSPSLRVGDLPVTIFKIVIQAYKPWPLPFDQVIRAGKRESLSRLTVLTVRIFGCDE
jgi:hypothetical protein